MPLSRWLKMHAWYVCVGYQFIIKFFDRFNMHLLEPLRSFLIPLLTIRENRHFCSLISCLHQSIIKSILLGSILLLQVLNMRTYSTALRYSILRRRLHVLFISIHAPTCFPCVSEYCTRPVIKRIEAEIT